MNIRSIRWKLSLSYAGIALLTTLALGVALLLPLRAYYRDREREYLMRNAESLALALSPLLSQSTPQPLDLDTHIKFLAFLSQARVRVVNTQEQQITDSGPSDLSNAVQVAAMRVPAPSMDSLAIPAEKASGDLIIRFDANEGSFQSDRAYPYPAPWTAPLNEDNPGTSASASAAEAGGETSASGVRFFFSNAAGPVALFRQEPGPQLETKSLVSVASVSNTMYGFELMSDGSPMSARSDEVYRHPVFDQNGGQVAWVELSDGPAYGSEIVSNVASGWAIASLVAVIVAASAGWWISRRMSAPLLALTDVTRKMADGDLSARASFSQSDEFGSLGRSFNDMAGRVETTVSTLRRFASDAAHELHTPLTALRTNLELALYVNDPRDYLQRAAEQVTRLEHLTNDLLDLSRIEGGSPAPEPAPVDLNTLLSQVCEPFAAQAEQAGVDFRLVLPDDALVVTGQQSRLTQAISNLVDNALKFSSPNGWVEVGLERVGDEVVMWVEDNGIGIGAEDLPALFQRFHRGRNAAMLPGSGLGLSIVKAIVTQHGGKVGVESRPGKTRFTITLPV